MLSKLWDTLKKKNHTYYEQGPKKVDLFLKNFNSLKHLAPVYIDKTGFDTYFYREYSRSLKGQLIRDKVSGRRYQRISLVAGLTNGELYSMKIKGQTRKLATGCSKHCFEVVDKTDEVSSKHCFEVVDRTDEVSNHIYGKVKLTWFEEIFEEY